MGFAIEVGRPNIGSRLKELEKFSRVFAKAGITFEPKNPLTNLIDPKTGDLPPEIIDEKVISAIVEFSVPQEKTLDVLSVIKEVSGQIDTVMSLDLACRADPDGKWPIDRILEQSGIFKRPNAKINVGLGKPFVG